MPKGNKVCPQCNGNNGPRSFNCKHCGYAFKNKKEQGGKITTSSHSLLANKNKIDLDWKELNKGDIIRVHGNAGPFYTSPSGEKTFMSYRGKFRVVSLDSDGINAHGVGLKSPGYVYIYMGQDKPSSVSSSITLSKHKIARN